MIICKIVFKNAPSVKTHLDLDKQPLANWQEASRDSLKVVEWLTAEGRLGELVELEDC